MVQPSRRQEPRAAAAARRASSSAWVAPLLAAVAAAGQLAAVGGDHHRADRDVVVAGGRPGLLQGDPHPALGGLGVDHGTNDDGSGGRGAIRRWWTVQLSQLTSPPGRPGQVGLDRMVQLGFRPRRRPPGAERLRPARGGTKGGPDLAEAMGSGTVRDATTPHSIASVLSRAGPGPIAPMLRR
jgi:hypothetical protein